METHLCFEGLFYCSSSIRSPTKEQGSSSQEQVFLPVRKLGPGRQGSTASMKERKMVSHLAAGEE